MSKLERIMKYPEDHEVPHFDVYDHVWIMENNKPTEMIIFAVVVSMSYNKRGQEVHYQLVKEICGTGWGNYEGIRRKEKDFYDTKEDLLASL